jgi:hypothetical protein
MKIDVENSLITSSDFNGSNYFSDETTSSNFDLVSDKRKLQSSTLADKQDKEQAQKNIIARKRIDELIEKRRLKELLDDSEDW